MAHESELRPSDLVYVQPVVAQAMVSLWQTLPQLIDLVNQLSEKNRDLELGLQHYDKKQVAELFGVSPGQIWKWVNEGKLFPMYFSESNKSHLRFSYSEIKRFAEVNKRLSPTASDEATVLANAMPTRSKQRKAA